ncbi:MAG: LPXTG cell wall anchor domain-containing protein [Clostridia bacterium]|nr:LPXTG cell wall anchor domain-containing protein [Clostridia bacterium]
MKKFLALFLAAAVFVCGAFFLKAELSVDVSAKSSPTAPTVPDPSHTLPTSPVGPTPSGTTVPGLTSPTSPGITAPTATPSAVAPTTPDGSTVTGTVSDTSPESPETGDGASGIFAFAGVVVLFATAAVLSGKKKESEEE